MPLVPLDWPGEAVGRERGRGVIGGGDRPGVGLEVRVDGAEFGWPVSIGRFCDCPGTRRLPAPSVCLEAAWDLTPFGFVEEQEMRGVVLVLVALGGL